MSKESKTARASTGKKGGAGRANLCPTHGLPLEPVILVPSEGRPHDGWACHAGGRPAYPLMPCPTTHYLTRGLEEWRP